MTNTRKKRDRKERTNRESGRGESQQPGRSKRRSYSEAVIEGALRTERVFMGDPKTDKTLNKGEDVVVCLPGARIEHVTDRVENVLRKAGQSTLVMYQCRQGGDNCHTRLVGKLKKT